MPDKYHLGICKLKPLALEKFRCSQNILALRRVASLYNTRYSTCLTPIIVSMYLDVSPTGIQVRQRYQLIML